MVTKHAERQTRTGSLPLGVDLYLRKIQNNLQERYRPSPFKLLFENVFHDILILHLALLQHLISSIYDFLAEI